jgi:peptide deformylase
MNTNTGLVIYPDSVLRKVCEPVDEFDESIENISGILHGALTLFMGYGIAAPQIGVNARMFAINMEIAKDRPCTFINPTITDTSGESKFKEGCLSIPGVWAWVKRPNAFKITAFDEKGEEFSIETDNVEEDVYWTCILHEYDHLDGKLFVDHLEPFEANKVNGAINKLKRKASIHPKAQKGNGRKKKKRSKR